MSQRFFVETPIHQETAELTGAEAQHLVKVMRAGIGTQVTLFDGSGDEFAARISQIERAHVRLDNIVRHRIDRELPFPLQLAVALPKGDRQRWMVEKLTEIGVESLVPLVTARSIVRPDQGAVARLNRVVIESSKQCGRNRLMEITPPRAWHEYVASIPASTLRMIAHPPPEATLDSPPVSDGSKARGEPLASFSQSAAQWFACGGRTIAVAVGPEGGLTGEEVELALAAGWTAVSLGPRVLRVETAAVALAAVLSLR